MTRQGFYSPEYIFEDKPEEVRLKPDVLETPVQRELGMIGEDEIVCEVRES